MNIVRYSGNPENPTVTVVGTLAWDAATRQLSYDTRDPELAQLLRGVLKRGAVPHFVPAPPPPGGGCADGIAYAIMNNPKFLTYLEDCLVRRGLGLVREV